MKFSVFQMSEIGARARNEDRMGYCYTRQSALFMLADGMGGHTGGEIAAHLSLQVIANLYQKVAKTKINDPLEFLNSALLVAHRSLGHYTNNLGLPDSPRTTLALVLLQDNQAYWLHCGDSRIYIVRNGSLFIRTRDHSYDERKDEIDIPPARGEVNRNVLYTCVGGTESPISDCGGGLSLELGDKILLCSDGLWSALQETDIVESLSALSVKRAIPRLVNLALSKAGGSSDNVTGLAIEWEMQSKRTRTGGERLSTLDLQEGVFASTIQSTINEEEDATDGEEKSIERSIQEINDAIERSRLRKD